MLKSVKTIFKRNESLSICPYYDIDTEYRLVMLEGKCMLCFGKKKAKDKWKFNLCQGASVVTIEDEALKTELISLAQKVVDAIGIAFASVDIIRLKTGELSVIEVNSRSYYSSIYEICLRWERDCKIYLSRGNFKNVIVEKRKGVFHEVSSKNRR